MYTAAHTGASDLFYKLLFLNVYFVVRYYYEMNSSLSAVGTASPAREDGQVNACGVKDCGEKDKNHSYPTIYPILDRHAMAEYGNS